VTQVSNGRPLNSNRSNSSLNFVARRSSRGYQEAELSFASNMLSEIAKGIVMEGMEVSVSRDP